MSSRRGEIITVILECEHRQDHRYHASVGEWTYCSVCNSTRRVSKTSEVIACCDDCTVKRKFGNPASAHTWIRAHVTKHSHTGKIITADLSLTMIQSSGTHANR